MWCKGFVLTNPDAAGGFHAISAKGLACKLYRTPMEMAVNEKKMPKKSTAATRYARSPAQTTGDFFNSRHREATSLASAGGALSPQSERNRVMIW